MHAQSEKVPLSVYLQLRSSTLLQPPFVQEMIGLFDPDLDSSSFGEPYDGRLGRRRFSLVAEIAYGTYLPTF